MYLGIDFLISSELRLYVAEVNVGLPGGAQEYDLTHLVYLGEPSDIFDRIESTAVRVYGKIFKDYLHSLPFIETLKPFKLWMDGKGSLPGSFHPALRLEDKWVQYQLLRSIAPMPETIALDPEDLPGIDRFLARLKKAVLKRRVGRGGRDLAVIDDPRKLWQRDLISDHYLLQEYVESRIDGDSLSIRAVAFAGEFMCMYANLSPRTTSNHGMLTFVAPGSSMGLKESRRKTVFFNQRSWEAEIWFGEKEPGYLRHNLYEDEVSTTALLLPDSCYREIQKISVKIERLYEELDVARLPKACFEEPIGR